MRILFLLSSLETGGAERVGANLCSEWAADGHAVTMMPTFRHATALSAFPVDPRVRILPIADICDGTVGWLPKVAALRREIRFGAYDVVCSFLTNVNVLALVAAIGTGCPVVVSERTYPPAFNCGRILSLARRMLYPRAAMVVMQTKDGLSWLSQAVPRARGAVLPNPLRYPLPNHQPCHEVADVVTPDRRVLLAVGRLSEEKRFGWLISQFANVAAAHPEWSLVILGGGPEEEDLAQIVRRYGLGNCIKLAGMTGNLDDWYRRADAFVSVSRFEGYPNAIAEAVGYGLPSLAVDCLTGPSELIVDGENGILLPSNASDAQLSDGLAKLMTTPLPKSEDHARSLQRRLALPTVAEQWLGVFQAAVHEKAVQ